MFKVRDEVEPIFTLEELGEIYVIDEMLNRDFPIMFLGYCPKNDKLYTFNCSDVMVGYYVEYLMFETSFDQINRSTTKELEAIELMQEVSDADKLYLLMLDKDGYEEMELCYLEDLPSSYMPNRNTYYLYNKQRINNKKMG